jgi:predicted dienelactone hydrolase
LFGPFAVNVATGPAPTPGRHPLVLLFHGAGGHELGESWLAERLAAAGYVVVALRHPGPNFQDRRLIGRAGFLTEPPRHVSRVLDQVLATPQWAALVDTSRIAAIGASIGGHTVLALAGGCPDPALGQAEDPAGFDRRAWQARACQAFLASSLR